MNHVLANWDGDRAVRFGEFYRDLHRHPELSFQEYRTASIDALLDLWSGFVVYRESIRGVGVTENLLEQLVEMALAGSVPRLT